GTLAAVRVPDAEQEEEAAGEDQEHPAAEPVLLRARQVTRNRRDVGERDGAAGERLQRQAHGEHHADQGDRQMGEPGGAQGGHVRRCASAGAQTTNSEMPARRARTISETPARRGRLTRLGALWSCAPRPYARADANARE